MKLKIYCNQQYLISSEPTIPLLFPFFGVPQWEKYHDSKFNKDAFNVYLQKANNFFEIAEKEKADILVFPYDWARVKNNQSIFNELINHYTEVSRQTGKDVLVFCTEDPLYYEGLIPFKNSIIFHTSILSTQKPENVFVLPSFVNDTFEQYEGKEFRVKREVPIVGFCGFAPPFNIPFSKYKFKEIIRMLVFRYGIDKKVSMDPRHSHRANAIYYLQKSKLLEKNFNIRPFSGFDGNKGMFLGNNDKFYENFRKEYFENIINSDYILCSRGNGNYSIRFFESLCHGRIPVFIETKSILPFDFLIDWSKYVVIIKENEISKIAEKIELFHSQFSPAQFLSLQEKLRSLWKEYFSPEGFYSQIFKVVNYYHEKKGKHLKQVS